MVHYPVIQCQCISFRSYCSQPSPWSAALLVSHTNRTVKHGVGISIRWIKKIEDLIGKIQPAFAVKIFCMVPADIHLELFLPWRNYFMIWFGSRSKIVWIIYALLMKIYMHLRHPSLVFFYPGYSFFLRLPSPITVQVIVIMVESSTRPGFMVLSCRQIRICCTAHHIIKPIDIAISAIRI